MLGRWEGGVWGWISLYHYTCAMPPPPPQCRGGEGACPDTMVTVDGETPCTDDIRSDSVVGGIRGNNQQCVIFSRPFTTSMSACAVREGLGGGARGEAKGGDGGRGGAKIGNRGRG